MGERPHYLGFMMESRFGADLIISLQALYKFAKASVC